MRILVTRNLLNEKFFEFILARCPERISFVIQKQRNEIISPDEGYLFKFYKMGKWMTCKVDKLLPKNIAAVAKDNEHWVPYCEKAYAKETDSNY